jgi:hypothetical protein
VLEFVLFFLPSLWIHTMNRCTPQAPRATFLHRFGFAAPLALALCAMSLAAAGQDTATRPFPPKAERGVMQVTQPPDLLLNGKPDRFSPGARIVGTNNMLVLSGQLIGQKAVVNFVREPNGQVHQVWILTEAEAALKLPTSP